jgi:NADH:ubiquinone oxidoreductase subunit E
MEHFTYADEGEARALAKELGATHYYRGEVFTFYLALVEGVGREVLRFCDILDPYFTTQDRGRAHHLGTLADEGLTLRPLGVRINKRS